MEYCSWTVGVATACLLILMWRRLCKATGFGTAPEPPGAWPILGHLPLLNTRKTQRFRIISALSEEHGPVFGLRLGLRRVVFVNSWEAAKECFTLNDKALAARPPSTAVGKYICHNDAYFGIASGEYWREMRKITMTELLSSTKLTELNHLHISEINEFIKELHDSSIQAETIDMSCWFARFSVNIITTIIARKRFPCNHGGGDHDDDDAEKVHKAIKDLLYAFGLPVMSDAIPWKIVEWWDPQGHIRMMRRIGRKLDEVVVGWIDEHQGRSMPHHDRGEIDFIDMLLSQVGEGKLMFDKLGKDIVIISTVESIIAGAVDTTSATLTWLITLLMNHPQAMTHAKGEINHVVGAKRWVEHSDMDNLVYLNAVIKETMRLYPAGSLGPPHMAVEDCLIGGFRVKRGTKLLCNIWKLQRDPKIWDDPDEFKPERFLSGGAGRGGGRVNVPKEHTFMYMPFGAGRRICPGKDLVMRVLPLVLARLIQGFEFSTPSGKPVVDVAEGFGAILHKATPLEVVVTPRLPPEMYSN